MKPIASAANPTFRHWLRLATQPRAVRTARRTLADGIHLAQAALDAGVAAEALLLRRGAHGTEIDALVVAIERSGAPSFEVAPTLFDRLSPVQASAGVMLELRVPLPDLPGTLTEDLVYLDRIQDPGNAGALLRVAAAAGVRWVSAAPGTAALWAPRTLRASQGAHFALKVVEEIDAATAAARFAGAWIGADAHDAQPLWAATLSHNAVGWVFGAEGQGLSREMLELCAQRVRIPLAAGVESLNVAAAAAICLFERRRRLDSVANP